MPLTVEQREAALALRAQGYGWIRIGWELGLSDYRLQRDLVPGFAERRKAYENDRAAERARRQCPPIRAVRRAPDDLDGKTLTASLMGDPPPGRSALDQRAKGLP
jgi:hypothetical protein